MSFLGFLRRRAPAFGSALGSLLAALAVFAAPAAAQLEVDVTRGNLDPLPIAIVDFLGDDPEMQQLGREIAGVIENNLDRSSLFRPIDESAFIERIDNPDVQPRFADWRAIGAQALVVGRIERADRGQLVATFRLWDNTVQQQLAGVRLQASAEDWRRIAHKVSDRIYERLTGEGGYFDTRVVFVSETGPKLNRVKRLGIMDQDGANPSFLTNGEHLVLTPRFSPTAQEITFLSFASGVPQVYLFDIDTGRREIVGGFPGMTIAPRYSPDGQKLLLSYIQNGDTNVWSLDLRTRQRTQLTNNPGIDTGGSFSPDGSKIVFESDRSGTQQLYVMNADGSGQTRISNGQGRYGTPVWSPRGDLIAFTRQNRGSFHIGVMRPDGSGERLLTEGYLVEGPTWSPNGRVILFTRETRGPNGGPEVRSIDLTGVNDRRMPTVGGASDPAWSPLLP